MDPELLIGRTVHYVATNAVRQDKSGAAHPDIRAMMITGAIEQDGKVLAHGLIFRAAGFDQIFPTLASEVKDVLQNEEDHFAPGTWHYSVFSRDLRE